ncbi:MAG: CCA tRNA nucleotidyltransferase [Phycisphaerae bacterium]|nr:CCA tRNA nucleotidyltransferase [Phycisphaerae bacterium]
MPDTRTLALNVVRTLREQGHVAYLAGGCVRDEVLGLHPQDYDVATDARPETIRALFKRTSEVGAHFGVVLVREGPTIVEVATFRADGPYSDRRRPEQVRFSTPEEDARRRDFTVNALFLDPFAPGDPGGRVIDFVGGRADLDARLIRAVGDPDARFQEDDLRTLRAVRFAARLDFEIEPATAEAIRRHAGDLRGISRERIGDEIRRMLTHPSRGRAVGLLRSLGLDAPVLCEPTSRSEPRRVAALAPGAEFACALAAWMLDRGFGTGDGLVDAVGRWRAALCLSNQERDALLAIMTGVARLQNEWPTATVAGQKRLAASDWFLSAVEVIGTTEREAASAIQGRRDELAATPGGLAPPPLLTGDDLIASGMHPGPSFKKVLDLVYDAQLEGRVMDSSGALELARRVGVQGV